MISAERIGVSCNQPFKQQPHKMVKSNQAICWLLPTNCLSVFGHFVGLALKGSKKVLIRNHIKITPFLANDPISFSLKTPENQWFLGVLRGHKIRTLARYGLGNKFSHLVHEDYATKLSLLAPLLFLCDILSTPHHKLKPSGLLDNMIS